MKPKIVLISGKQGSGKSTLSENLTKKFEESDSIMQMVMRMRFAAVLYDMQDAIKRVAFNYNIPMEEKEGRLLQLLGTEWGRKVKGDNVWVDALKHKMLTLRKTYVDPIFIIDDCRFQNEFHAFPDAFKIRLRAKEEVRKARADSWREDTNHQSETDLDGIHDSEFNLVLYTDEFEKGTTAKRAFDEAIEFWESSK